MTTTSSAAKAVKMVNDYYVCQLCGRNKENSQKKVKAFENPFLENLRDQYETTGKAMGNMFVDKKRDPEHVPEWTKKRRL